MDSRYMLLHVRGILSSRNKTTQHLHELEMFQSPIQILNSMYHNYQSGFFAPSKLGHELRSQAQGLATTMQKVDTEYTANSQAC